MKKYVKPMMSSELFMTNEYVAACYKIRCMTPNRNSTYYYLYNDANDNGVWDSEDQLLYKNYLGFRGCNNWHSGVIRDEAPSANGFVTKGTNPNSDTKEAVFWWEEDFHDGTVDYHVMTPGKENYETNPNAS